MGAWNCCALSLQSRIYLFAASNVDDDRTVLSFNRKHGAIGTRPYLAESTQFVFRESFVLAGSDLLYKRVQQFSALVGIGRQLFQIVNSALL